MLAWFNKTCPCLPLRGDSKPSFSNFSYDDEDNNLDFEFENLIDGQNILSRAPFANSQSYRRVTNMIIPNGEASASTVRLLDDEDNLQTQDAQFLPDEQISKFTELINEQGKHEETDEQLAAEEEEARRAEEEAYERNRIAATEAAIAKGLIQPDQVPANNRNMFFTVDDDDGDDGQVTDSSRTVYSMNLDGGSSVELSSQRNASTDDEEQNISLNKPRNPHERFVESEIHEDDYDDVTDFEETSNYDRRPSNLLSRRYSRRNILRENESKMEDYSPFSVSVLRPDDYEANHEDYSPTVGDEEIDHPFANILPDFERLSSFFNGLTNSMKIKGKNKLINKDEVNKEIINQNNNQEINNLNDLDTNNNKNSKKKMVAFTVEPESGIEPYSPTSHSFAFGGGNSVSGRRSLRRLGSGLSNPSRSSSTEVNE